MGRIPIRKLLTIGTLLSSLYTGSYGLVRWRNVLVHTETYVGALKDSALVSHIEAGIDLGTTSSGAFKNAIAKPLEVVYAPLCSLEAHYRNVWRS